MKRLPGYVLRLQLEGGARQWNREGSFLQLVTLVELNQGVDFEIMRVVGELDWDGNAVDYDD